MIVFTQKKQIGRQLDYVFVSKRWASSVTNCRVRWEPSIHRNTHGVKADHALLECTWKWRIRTYKPQPVRDFSVLRPPQGGQNESTIKPNEHLIRFSNAIQAKLQELGHERSDPTDKLHSDITAAIQHAIETTLPIVKKLKRQRRKVSAHTKSLIDKRSRGKRRTKKQVDDLQAKIRQAGLDDFKQWVQTKSDEMTEANWRGDTKKIFEVVNTLSNKSEKPPANLTTDGQGNILGCAEDVANRWYHFLKYKFAATSVEQGRSGMAPLPTTQGQDELTVKEIEEGLTKMQGGKACGPDEIPVEVYKLCPVCRDLLILLVKAIWCTEVWSRQNSQRPRSPCCLNRRARPMTRQNIGVSVS